MHPLFSIVAAHSSNAWGVPQGAQAGAMGQLGAPPVYFGPQPGPSMESPGYIGEPFSWGSFFDAFVAASEDPESFPYHSFILSHVGPFYAAGIATQRGRALTPRQRMYWGTRGVLDGLLEDCESVARFGFVGQSLPERCWGGAFNLTRGWVRDTLANGVSAVTKIHDEEDIVIPWPFPDSANLRGHVVGENVKMWESIEDAVKIYLNQKLGFGPTLTL